MFLTILLQAASAAALAKAGGALAASITAIAAALGIGRIGDKAMEAIARQPEAAGDVRSNMVVAAALVEGVSLFAVIVCMLAVVLS